MGSRAVELRASETAVGERAGSGLAWRSPQASLDGLRELTWDVSVLLGSSRSIWDFLGVAPRPSLGEPGSEQPCGHEAGSREVTVCAGSSFTVALVTLGFVSCVLF